jgi:transposase
MDHVAIDLGSRESQICVRTGDGEILEEKKVATRSLGKYLSGRPKSRVVVEACAEAFPVADAAEQAGHETVVVPASLAPSLGVGDRGIKTDVRDARNLSEASCRMRRLPKVHVPTRESRDRKSMCGMREGLVQTRTKLVNSVRGWARAQGLGAIKSGYPMTFSHRARAFVLQRGAQIPGYLERVLVMIESLSVQIHTADEELETMAKSDATCQLLMTAPGIGPTASVRLAAAVDDVSRFANAHKLESYLGMTPGENSSSTRKRRSHLTKAGPAKMRWALVQSAWVARRYYKDHPIVLWSFEVEKRRGKKVAVIALARRLVGVLYAMWRDQKPYDKDHHATRAQTSAA